MCNIKVTLISNGSEEVIDNVTQIDFDFTDIFVTTFFEPVRVLNGFAPVIIDFLAGNVVLEKLSVDDE